MRVVKKLLSWAGLLSVDDTGPFRTSILKAFGKTGKVFVITPYGFDHNPPPGSLALVFQANADEGNRACLASYPQKRFKELKPGEVKTGNPITGSYVYFKENGEIEINSENNLKVTVKGNVDLNVTGNVQMTVGGNIAATAGGGINITATGDVNLGGTGGARLARIGDRVNVGAGSSTGLWPIVEGSSKVNAI